MKMRLLGKTGLQVSELSLGGLFVASFASPLEEASAAVSRALDLGINYIDTAPMYGNSEEVLGKSLVGEERPLILSTKIGGRPEPFEPQNADCLLASVEESLRLLGRENIDILMIHEPNRPGQYDSWSDRENFTGPVLDVLARLKEEGKIRFTGIGGTTTHELARLISTGRFDVALIAYNYSLLWREAQIEAIPASARYWTGIILGSPLQQGALARRYDEQIANGAPWMSKPRRDQFKALYRYLDEIDMSIAEVGLRFCLSNFRRFDCSLRSKLGREGGAKRGRCAKRIIAGQDHAAPGRDCSNGSIPPVRGAVRNGLDIWDHRARTRGLGRLDKNRLVTVSRNMQEGNKRSRPRLPGLLVAVALSDFFVVLTSRHKSLQGR